MKFLAVIVVLTVIVVWWVLHGREWLKTQSWSQGFFDWIEPLERILYKKSETIFWARWLQFVGYLIAVLAFVGTLDVTPFLGLVPEKYQWIVPLLPVAISLAGHMAEFMRNRTTLPIEVVALPPTAPEPLKDMAATAVMAKEETVTAIKEAKKEGLV